MAQQELDSSLEDILEKYSNSFKEKGFGEESDEVDVLMQVFNVTQEIKIQNRQYWGRELGMCWQLLVTELCKQKNQEYRPAIRDGGGELCDLVVGKDAIDTKYRIGSGDSGTLKKFKQYGKVLKDMGYRPLLLIIRTDNLDAAITACRTGGWTILTGNTTFSYVQGKTDFDIKGWLEKRRGKYSI